MASYADITAVAQEFQISPEGKQLRNSKLCSISHVI